jgi:hypothetical protein
VRRLFVFGSFTHDPQSVLAAVYGLAFVGIELALNIIALELSVASFADAKSLFHDPQFALRHDCSLAHAVGEA